MTTQQTPDQGIKDYLSVADFDAYEVLVGSASDHVLAAITLTEGTVLGRKTGPGEVIKALSASDLLGLAFPSADPHYAYMGPVSAPAAAPTWRAMVAKDIPDISADYISATTAITANRVLAGPTTGAAAAPTFRMLDSKDVPDLSATYSVLAHKHGYLPLAGGTLIGDLYAPTIYGSATASGTLLLKGTSNATLGNVQIGAYSSFNDATGFVGIGTLTPAQKLDVQSGAIRFSYVPTISAAGCTFAAGAAGVNTVGVHRIKITAINALGETEAGTMSGTYTVATNEQINVSDILVSPDPTVTGRNIWATKAGGSIYYRVAASPCMDNIATAYTINVADASLTANAAYVYNRTSGVIYFGSRPLIYTDGQATGLYIGGDGTDYYNSLVTSIGAGSGGLIYFRSYSGASILGVINTYGIGSLAAIPVSGENFALLGTSAAKVTQQRATVAGGFSLTVNAAGAKSGGTDLAAGELILSSGISTGAGVGAASLWAAPAGAAGVGDNAPVRVLTATALSGGAAGTTAIGIGTPLPTAFFDIEKSGTAKSTVDFVEITNLVNAADMDATGTGILFNQWYYDAETPAVLPSARIAAVCENDWTSAQSNSSLDFYTRMRPNTELKMRLNSRGTLMLGGTDMNADVYNAIHLFYNGNSSNTPTANSITILGVDSIDSTTALGILTEQVIQDGTIVVDKKVKIKWNGVWYYLGLTAVGA